MATGAFADYDGNFPDDHPCGKLPNNYCDDTLLHVDIDPTFWKTRVGGVRITIDQYRPQGLSDFDMFIYRSDAEGNITYSPDVDGRAKADLIPRSSHVAGAGEAVAIPKAAGYYLVRVVYFAVTQSQYSGKAELVWRDPLPPEQQQPLGRRFSLPSVSSGVLPGPSVLYDDDAVRAPQLENRHPRFNADPLLVSGTEAYVKGEYLYQDFLYDDHGSDTDASGGGFCVEGKEHAGDLTYPTDRQRFGGNAADLVEFRIDVAPDSVAYRITLNTLLQADSTIVAIAFDTDRDATTGANRLRRDPGVDFPGTDELIATWGTGAEHVRYNSEGSITKITPLSASADVLTDLEANQITVIVPRSVSNPRTTWRTIVAAGLYRRPDPSNPHDIGGWLMPQEAADETTPGGADRRDPTGQFPLDANPTAIFNLAFRFDEPVLYCNQPPDSNQAVALREKKLKGYAHEIDFAALAAGSQADLDGDGVADGADNCPSIPNRDQADRDANSVGDACRTAVPTHGTQVRIFPSRLDQNCEGTPEPWKCEGRDPLSTSPNAATEFPGYRGRLQPYSIYIPLRYALGTPTGLTLALHGANSYYFFLNGTNWVQQLGELRDNLVVQPLGRGGLSWWRHEGEYDVFEVWNEVAARFTLDPDSVVISGASHGGYGVYRLGTLYPDLFGKAFSGVAPPGEGAWIPPTPPTGLARYDGDPDFDGSAPETLTNLYLENTRNLPFMNVVFATDELVLFVGPRAQNLGAPEYGIKGFNDYGYRFLFRAIDVSEHLFLGVNDFPGATEFLGDARVERNPRHVTLAYVPKADEPNRSSDDPAVMRRGLVHNHAYWVSDLTLANSDKPPDYGHPPLGHLYPAKGMIDAFSHGFGLGDPPSTFIGPTQCIPGTTAGPGAPPGVVLGCGTQAYTQFERTWGEAPPIPPDNRLDLKLSNLGAATVDLKRAGLDACQPITLVVRENDSPSDLTLAGSFTAATANGASLVISDKGAVVHLREKQLLEAEYRLTIIPTCAQPDLKVTNIVASSNHVRQGEKVTITATIANTGSAVASASKTEFLLDEATLLGLVETPPIPAGGTATVAVQWRTAGVHGEHIIRVTADKTNVVAESNEGNNIANLAITVKANRVTNGSFEQASAGGAGPAGWAGSNTGAGTTAWSEGGSDGTRGAAVIGNGGNVRLAGSPRWTSDVIAVTPGEVLSLVVAARSDGMSSPAAAGLVYLGAGDDVLGTVTVLSVPLTTGGLATLEQLVTIPAGVTQVRVVLSGFTASDTATAGAVTFDEVGLFGG